MPWGRAILAVVAAILVLGGMGALLTGSMGAWKPDFSSAPGVNPQDVAALSEPFEDLRLGRDAALIARFSTEIPRDQAQAEMDRIQTLLPPGEPTSSRTTFMSATVGTGGNRLAAVREYEYPDHVVRSETTLLRQSSNERWSVEGFHINVASRAELAGSHTGFAQQTQLAKAVIVAAVIVPLFTLVTFWAALFWPGVKRRWLWLLMSAIGVMTVRVVLGTDQWEFSPLSFQIFGAGAIWSGSSFDSWVVSASAPLGALLFWITRLFQRKQEPAAA
jgi:hypothetical protein